MPMMGCFEHGTGGSLMAPVSIRSRSFVHYRLMDDQTGGYDLDALAASMKADASDVKIFFQVFGSKLEGAMPDSVEIEREGGLFHKDHSIKMIKVTLGEDVFEAEMRGGHVVGRHGHSVRGITLRTEELDFEQWRRQLVATLSTSAGSSATARAALESLINS